MKINRNLLDNVDQTIREYYIFQLEPERLDVINRAHVSQWRKKWLFYLATSLTVICIGGIFSMVLLGVGISIALYGLFSVVIGMQRNKNIIKTTKERYQTTVFAYTVYESCLGIQISRDDMYREMVIPFDQIKNHRMIQDLVVFEIDHLIYTIDTKILPEDSYFLLNAKRNV